MRPLIKSATLLIVEDDPDARLLLHHLLEQRFALRIEASIDAGTVAAAEEQFDALILDINFGEARTGLDLLRAIRASDHHKNVPALALTAYALPGDEDHYLGSGFDGYISKPFSRDLLYSALDRILMNAPISHRGKLGIWRRGRIGSVASGRYQTR